jgi:hypothetical protein
MVLRYVLLLCCTLPMFALDLRLSVAPTTETDFRPRVLWFPIDVQRTDAIGPGITINQRGQAVVIRATGQAHGSQVRIDCQRTIVNLTIAIDADADRRVLVVDEQVTAMTPSQRPPIVAQVPLSRDQAFGVAVMSAWPVATYLSPNRGGVLGPLPNGVIAYRSTVGEWNVPCLHDEGIEPTMLVIVGRDDARGYKPIVAPQDAPRATIIDIRAPAQGWYTLKVPAGIASMTCCLLYTSDAADDM